MHDLILMFGSIRRGEIVHFLEIDEYERKFLLETCESTFHLSNLSCHNYFLKLHVHVALNFDSPSPLLTPKLTGDTYKSLLILST